MTDRRSLDRLTQSHYCPDCGERSYLVVRCQAGEWYVQCRCGNRDRFVRRKSLTQMWREDPESVPWNIRQNLDEKYGRGVGPLTGQEIARIDEPTMIQRLEKARWMKDITPQDRPVIAALAVQYGLDPVMGELIVYENKPYVTFQGWLRKIQEHPQFAGIADRPMRQEEREAYGYDAPVCWIAEIHRHDWKVPAVGTGTADPGNPYRNNPAEKRFPQAFARKRAIIQAAKVGFLHSLPFAKALSAEEAGISVDTRTGEILAPEPQVRVLTPEEVESTDAFTTIADSFPDDELPEEAPVEEEEPTSPVGQGEKNRLDALKRFKDAVAARRFNYDIVAAQFESSKGHSPEEASVDELNAAIETVKVTLAKKST